MATDNGTKFYRWCDKNHPKLAVGCRWLLGLGSCQWAGRGCTQPSLYLASSLQVEDQAPWEESSWADGALVTRQPTSSPPPRTCWEPATGVTMLPRASPRQAPTASLGPRHWQGRVRCDRRWGKGRALGRAFSETPANRAGVVTGSLAAEPPPLPTLLSGSKVDLHSRGGRRPPPQSRARLGAQAGTEVPPATALPSTSNPKRCWPEPFRESV